MSGLKNERKGLKTRTTGTGGAKGEEKETDENVTYFNLKMQLSRNGCRDCLFTYQGGGYKRRKEEKK